jgi:hypothetical protein
LGEPVHLRRLADRHANYAGLAQGHMQELPAAQEEEMSNPLIDPVIRRMSNTVYRNPAE